MFFINFEKLTVTLIKLNKKQYCYHQHGSQKLPYR